MVNISSTMVPVMINKLQKRLNRTNAPLLKQYGLSKLHLLYLMVLLENESGMTLKELSDYLGFDKANTSRAISQLIAKNYVQKLAQGGLALKYKVELTAKGREVASAISHQNQYATAGIVALFSPQELTQLSSIGLKLWHYLAADDN